MARFKRKSARRSSRRSFFSRSARRSSNSGGNPLMSIVLPAFAYGAVRQTAKNYAAPLTAMLPLGDNNDEVVFGLGGYLLMKNTSGFMHDFGKAMLYVEAASLGNNIGNPLLSGVTGSISNASNGAIYGV